MKIISRAVLAASVPLALSIGAAQAQSPGESSEGTGEAPRAISTATLPDQVVMRQAPVVEDLSVVEEVGRDILNEEALRERFAVITHSADGTVTESEASDALIRALMGENDAPAPEGESEPDPAFESEEVERFVGPDDRRRQITDPSVYPVMTVGLLYSVYGEMGASCSATLIGPATLITAAHCVYDHDNGWPDNILFAPAMMDEGTFPYGIWEYDEAHIVAAYVSEYNGVYGEVIPFDLAVVNLQDRIGDELGWLGFAPSEEKKGFSATILAYPGDKPFGTMWQSNCDISFDGQFSTDLAFVHYCETYQGSSGGSQFAYYPLDGNRVIYGINVAEVQGEGGFNISVRMNETYFQWVAERWK